MKRTIQLTALLIGILLACKPEVDCGCVQPPPEVDAKLPGRWQLTKITYGLTQKSVTPAEAGYTETLEYATDGKYRRLRNDQEVEKGNFRSGENLRQVIYPQAIFYTEKGDFQPYKISDGRLFMYDRMPQDATLADGSTYEYSKQ